MKKEVFAWIFWVLSGNLKPFLLNVPTGEPLFNDGHTSIIPNHKFLIAGLIWLIFTNVNMKLQGLNFLRHGLQCPERSKNPMAKNLSKSEAICIFFLATGYPRFKYPGLNSRLVWRCPFKIAAQFLIIYCVTICSEVWHQIPGIFTHLRPAKICICRFVSFLFKPSKSDTYPQHP